MKKFLVIAFAAFAALFVSCSSKKSYDSVEEHLKELTKEVASASDLTIDQALDYLEEYIDVLDEMDPDMSKEEEKKLEGLINELNAEIQGALQRSNLQGETPTEAQQMRVLKLMQGAQTKLERFKR